MNLRITALGTICAVAMLPAAAMAHSAGSADAPTGPRICNPDPTKGHACRIQRTATARAGAAPCNPDPLKGRACRVMNDRAAIAQTADEAQRTNG